MEGESDNSVKRREKPVTRLNTKGCCFLCLQILNFKTEEGNETKTETTKPGISLRCVRRYLKIKLPKLSTAAAPPLKESNIVVSPMKQKDVEVDLCESCEAIVNQFAKSFLILEKFQMEVSYWLQRIQQRIPDTSDNPELVQSYSKRMTSDPETLTQLVFVDQLRKQIAKKGTKNESCASGPKVELFHLKNIEKYFTKSPQREEKSEDFGHYFEDDGSADDIAVSTSSPTPFDSSGNIRTSTPQVSTVTSIIYKRNPQTENPAKNHHLSKKFECSHCKKLFSGTSTLYKHKKACKDHISSRLAKPQSRETDTRNRFPCKVCGKKFRCKWDRLRHHNGVHLKERNYECDLCEKKFSRQLNLKEHKEFAHFGKTFYCKTCKKQFRFTRKGNFKRHEKQCAKKALRMKTEMITDDDNN